MLRTTIGAAQSVAVAIDKAEWPEVAGTISGDDTIFIATANARAQDALVARLRALFPRLTMAAATHTTGATPIVLAYSGGLDTSFLVPWIAEQQRRPVITVTVDTGGIDAPRPRTLAERARALGAVAHHQIDARAAYFEQVLRFLIMGNVRRGQLYPLCVGRRARHAGADHRAHGARARLRHGRARLHRGRATTRCASRWRCARWRPDLKVLAPVRDQAFKREEELAYLQQRGPAAAAERRAVLGQPRPVGRHHRRPGDAHLRGQHSRGGLAADARRLQRTARARAARARLRAGPAGRRSTARAAPPVEIIEALEALAAPFGIGRGIHLGDTIIGTKGRVAFEAPAAEVLLTAHRELEKLVLTARQQRIKERVAQPYGDLVHEGQLLDPVCRDIEALLLSSQRARHRRGAPAAADRQRVRRGRRVAALAHGRLPAACTARRPGEWSRGRCARVLAHRRAAGGVPRARRRAAPPEEP